MPYRGSEKQRETARRWRAANPKKAREYDRKYCAANPEKVRTSSRKYCAANPEKARARDHKYRAANAEKVRENARTNHLRHNYGLTSEEYDALLVTQDGRCAICERGDERLCVDHNHVTGVIRGLLCRKCNGGVGLLQDNPGLLDQAANYLRRNP